MLLNALAQAYRLNGGAGPNTLSGSRGRDTFIFNVGLERKLKPGLAFTNSDFHVI